MKKTIIGLLFMLMAVPVQAHVYSNDFEGETLGASVGTESWWDSGSVGVYVDDPINPGNTVVALQGAIGAGGVSTLWVDGFPNNGLEDMSITIEFDYMMNDVTLDVDKALYTGSCLFVQDADTTDAMGLWWNRTAASSVGYNSGVDHSTWGGGWWDDIAVP